MFKNFHRTPLLFIKIKKEMILPVSIASIITSILVHLGTCSLVPP